MAKRIKTTANKTRIIDTSIKMERIDPMEFAKAIGAEPMGPAGSYFARKLRTKESNPMANKSLDDVVMDILETHAGVAVRDLSDRHMNQLRNAMVDFAKQCLIDPDLRRMLQQ